MDYCVVSRGTFSQLTGLKIEVLNLNKTDMDNSLAACLTQFHTLGSIELSDTKFDNDGLKHLVALPLHRLVLSRDNIDDKGIKYLATSALKDKLVELNIEGTKVTGDALPVLAKFKKLIYLNISGTKISTADLLKSSKYLSGLQRLTVGMDPPLSARDIHDIRGVLPKGCSLESGHIRSL